MNASISYLLILVALWLPLWVTSAPPSPQPRDNLNATLNQLRTSVSSLRNNVQNHETEIRTFEEKLQTQESNFEALREELSGANESQKIDLQNFSAQFEAKLASLEHTLSSLITDMKQIKAQANDSVGVLGQYKQKLMDIETIIEAQNQQITQLEVTLKTIMNVLQSKDSLGASSGTYNKVGEMIQMDFNQAGTYKVQPGDTLEKIARKNNTTAKVLMELNQLANDKIKVGQTLKVK